MSDLRVANTIKSQIEAIDKMALWSYGAREFTGEGDNKNNYGSLTFSASNTNLYKQKVRVKIALAFNDTYTVTVFRVRGGNVKELFKMETVYCDMLVDVLDKALEGK